MIIREHQSTEYPPRTKENAKADVTVAMAFNFQTFGELCTRNAVTKSGGLYIPFDLKSILIDKKYERGNELTTILRQHWLRQVNSRKGIVLNIAGNGMQTIRRFYNIEQAELDFDIFKFFEAFNRWKFAHKCVIKVVSGGQSGIDEAGAKAFETLQYPVEILMPRNFRFRTKLGIDVQNKEQSLRRFTNYPYQVKRYKEKNEDGFEYMYHKMTRPEVIEIFLKEQKRVLGTSKQTSSKLSKTDMVNQIIKWKQDEKTEQT